MDKVEKIDFPDFIVETLEPFIDDISSEGEFFDDPLEFPNEESIELGRIHLWNILGKALLDKHLLDSEDILLTVEELEKILVSVVVQTNLDQLMKNKLVDGIENEHGEMVYWLTEKGREVHKSLDHSEDC